MTQQEKQEYVREVGMRMTEVFASVGPPVGAHKTEVTVWFEQSGKPMAHVDITERMVYDPAMHGYSADQSAEVFPPKGPRK